MAATATLNSTVQPILDTTQASQIVRGFISLTGSYTSGGDTLDISAYPVQSAQLPEIVLFTEQPSATVAPSGYLFYYQPGTTSANGLLRITSAAGTELTATTYPAALLAANIQFLALYPTGF